MKQFSVRVGRPTGPARVKFYAAGSARFQIWFSKSAIRMLDNHEVIPALSSDGQLLILVDPGERGLKISPAGYASANGIVNCLCEGVMPEETFELRRDPTYGEKAWRLVAVPNGEEDCQ
jgi:hypothetical protein